MSQTGRRLTSRAIAGRIRPRQSPAYTSRTIFGQRRLISDVRANRPSPVKNAPARAKAKAVTRDEPKQVRSRLQRSQVLKRQGLAAARKRHYKNLVRFKLLPTLAVLLFVCGLGVAGLQLKTNEKVKAQVQGLAVQHTEKTDDSGGDLPLETPPTGGLSSYRVAPTLPRTISIPKAKVNTRVVRTGVKTDNTLKAPANIFDAGWYEGSALPGEQGAVLINGHVHGPTQPGVFVNLKQLRPGDPITIERGDGKQFTYKVVKSQSYDVKSVDMGAVFSSAVPGKPGLNIITCDGGYDDAGNYDHRLVVFAVQQ